MKVRRSSSACFLAISLVRAFVASVGHLELPCVRAALRPAKADLLVPWAARGRSWEEEEMRRHVLDGIASRRW